MEGRTQRREKLVAGRMMKSTMKERRTKIKTTGIKITWVMV
jgi:hypothetical protein